MAANVQPISAPKQGEFRLQTERIEKLAAKLESAGDPEIRAVALDLVRLVIELHSIALKHMLDSFSRTRAGEQALSDALNDDLVSSMLLLHSLHPDDIEIRIIRGIEKVRPYLKSHGGDVELISVRDGIARLRLHGSCGSCPSSSITLKSAVEAALFEAAPDIVEIVSENVLGEAYEHSNLVILK